MVYYPYIQQNEMEQTMELEQARKRAEELRVIIEKNNRLYYDQDAPELEDFEYVQEFAHFNTVGSCLRQ